jgi:hypothetical protein
VTRLLLAALLCALGTTQTSAQNVVSQGLLELDDDERNASFTLMLRDSDRWCDQVIRTLFTGTLLGVDEWEARSAKTETPTRLASWWNRTGPPSHH